MNWEQILGIESGYMPATAASREGARQVCLDCMAKGPKHVRIDGRSKRPQFRYVQEMDRKDNRVTHANGQYENTKPIGESAPPALETPAKATPPAAHAASSQAALKPDGTDRAGAGAVVPRVAEPKPKADAKGKAAPKPKADVKTKGKAKAKGKVIGGARLCVHAVIWNA